MRPLRCLRVWLSFGALAAALSLPAAPATGQEGECGCDEAPVIPAGALQDDRVQSVVLGTVLSVEGSPRKKDNLVHEQQEHPYPWLRYLVLAEKSWGEPQRWLLIERPWARCGSTLIPGRKVLLTLPRQRDEAGTTMGSLRAHTVAGCHVAQSTDGADAATLLLGEPSSELDVREVMQAELGKPLSQITGARRWCQPNDTPQGEGSVSLMPGEWTEFRVPAAGEDVRWHVGQNGTDADGVDDVVLSVSNPTACWLHVGLEVRARWAVEGAARRLLRAGPGLTVEDGWVPPYWQGNVRLASEAEWIRKAELRVERFASPRLGLRGPRSRARALSRPEFQVVDLDPTPGTLVDVGSSVRARLRWDAFPDDPREGSRWQFAMLFEGKDGAMLEAPGGVSGDLSSQSSEASLATRLDAAFLARLKEPLQLRFVVRRLDAGSQGDGETVDALRPAVYPRGVEEPREPVPAPEKGAWYAGGSGLGCADAIVVRGVDSIQSGIAAERAWWSKEYPGSKMVQQGVSPPPDGDGRAYDHIELQLADGSELELCFDITEFWGAPAR